MSLDKDIRQFLRALTKVMKKQSVTIGRVAGLKSNSHLLQSFDVRLKTNISKYEFLANDYINYVDRGRKPFTTKVPIPMLIDWIQRYSINAQGMTTSQLAFAIQTNIYKFGIQPRYFMDRLADSLGDTVEDRLSKKLEDEIADEFVKTFKIK
jgi:hypothetical protein